MSYFRDLFRRWMEKPKFRPMGLIAPILVLLICLPLLRPLRHPDGISDDETATLAMVRGLVDHHDLSLDPRRLPPDHRVGVGTQIYSDQPPTFAILLAIP